MVGDCSLGDREDRPGWRPRDVGGGEERGSIQLPWEVTDVRREEAMLVDIRHGCVRRSVSEQYVGWRPIQVTKRSRL